jgi:hypothetical protein
MFPTWSITIVTIAIILSNSLPKSNLLVGESTLHRITMLPTSAYHTFAEKQMKKLSSQKA